MGTSPDNLDKVIELHKAGHFRMPAVIADLGCEQVYEDAVEASRRFLAHFGQKVPDGHPALLTKNSFTGHLFKAAGFDYRSFDIVDAPFCERLNLNVDSAPRSLQGRCDLVFNFGTTEHVMNQFNSMKIMHDLAKPGGLIYTLFLSNGYHWHGIVRYTPRFIDFLKTSNNYEVLYDVTHEQTFSEWRKAVGPNEPERSYLHDMSRWVIFKKTSDQPFKEIADIN
jgi:hypothetical protein